MRGTDYQTKPHKAMRARFRGRRRVKSRYAPRYPITAEREYRRISRAYVKVVDRSVKKHMDAVMKAYRREERKDSREDGIFDFLGMVHDAVLTIAAEVSLAMEEFDIQDKVEKIARMIQNRSVKEWIASVKATLGIDMSPDYYEGDTYEQVIRQWIARNYSYMQNIPIALLLSMETLIGNAYREGMPADELEKQIQGHVNTVGRRAEFAARDQVSTLNANLMKAQQTASGVRQYYWLSERDGAVRDCHQEFDGNVYSWDDPPDDWYVTQKYGVVYTGEAYNPGEAPGCRCVAIPLFEAEKFEPPI